MIDLKKMRDDMEFFAFNDVHVAQVNPGQVLDLLDMLEAAQKSLAQFRVYDDVISEIDRRADKEWCLGDGCDFTVTITYEQYLAIDSAMAATKGEQA